MVTDLWSLLCTTVSLQNSQSTRKGLSTARCICPPAGQTLCFLVGCIFHQHKTWRSTVEWLSSTERQKLMAIRGTCIAAGRFFQNGLVESSFLYHCICHFTNTPRIGPKGIKLRWLLVDSSAAPQDINSFISCFPQCHYFLDLSERLCLLAQENRS